MILPLHILEVNNLRFCLDIKKVNESLNDLHKSIKVHNILQAISERIDYLLSLASVEEWLTSSIQEERDFALTWLVPETIDQVRKCFQEGTSILISTFKDGEVIGINGINGTGKCFENDVPVLLNNVPVLLSVFRDYK